MCLFSFRWNFSSSSYSVLILLYLFSSSSSSREQNYLFFVLILVVIHKNNTAMYCMEFNNILSCFITIYTCDGQKSNSTHCSCTPQSGKMPPLPICNGETMHLQLTNVHAQDTVITPPMVISKCEHRRKSDHM